jgi:hypothetical protein
MNLSIIAFAHHRNGICGAPFDVVLFEDDGPDDGSRKFAILFEQKYHCAVLDVAKLSAGDIAFTSNSWRGDKYEPHLRKAIKNHESERPRTAAPGLMEALKQVSLALAHHPHWQPTMVEHLRKVVDAALAEAISTSDKTKGTKQP